MWDVLRTRGFFVFITMVFLNAFIDLGHKILIQNTVFKLYDGNEQVVLSTLVNALILLPFILFFTPSGFVSDKYSKVKVMRYSAWAGLATVFLITISYYLGWFWISFGLTFVLAIHSAFFSPAKMGYIRELLGDKQLPQGNAFAQSTVTLAIMLGTLVFSVFFELLLPSQESFTNPQEIMQSFAPLGWLLLALTGFEIWCAYQLPLTTDTDQDMKYVWQDHLKGKTGLATFQWVRSQQLIWLSIVGLSVFWAIAQVILATYPAYSKEYLNMDNVALVQALMACAGFGIIWGSLWAGRLSRTHIETGLIPVGAIGVMLSVSFITWIETPFFQAANFLFLGVMAGFFMVPLSALMQYHSPRSQLGRVLAAYNLVSTVAMLLFLVVTMLLAWKGLSSEHLFTVLKVVAVAGAIYTVYKLPQSLLRFIASRFFHAAYRLKVIGFENLPTSGGTLLLGNHISWIDWALVQMACPRQVRFVMERGYYERWYLKGILDLFGVIPIASGSSSDSLAEIARLLEKGEMVCLFPEGTISRTGQLAEFKRGYEKAVQGTNATIIPFYLHGLWGSRFSRSSGFLRESRQSGFKRDIIVSFGQPLPSDIPAYQLKQHIFDLSFTSWEAYSHIIDPIPVSWVRSAKRLKFRMGATDVVGEPLSNNRLMTAVFRFANLINHHSPEQNIGILLPTSSGSAIANMAVMTLGKTVVNLNYTASAEALQSAAEQAELKTLYTSKLFLKKLQERGIDIAAALPNLQLLYMEDLKAGITKPQLIMTLLAVVLFPTRLLQMLYVRHVNLDSTAAILFSSGSEGAPKGVELSHRNLAINSRQIADMLNTREDDVLMGTLPAFHAFGLLASTFMPLSEGIPIVCHPDPTDAVNIAKGIARYEATVLFGTATFLRLYARNQRVHPLMFESLRYVVAGAEKLPPEVRQLFSQRFNKAILEGYGTTETSPVASVNIPDKLDPNSWRVQPGSRDGTVGMPLPGTSFRIVDPVTMEQLSTGTDGLILIGGPQVMKGYLKNPEKTAEAVVDIAGQRWYKSGDKGHVDEDGFLTIVDRYSRFAKLGGEMVSLTAVEQTIRQTLKDPELDLVAVNFPDEKKGEKVVLLLGGEHDPKAVKKQLIESGMNPLMIPAEIYTVDAVPKLGSGKTDFATSRKVAQSAMA